MSLKSLASLFLIVSIISCSSNTKLIQGFERDSETSFVLGKVYTNLGYVSKQFIENTEKYLKDELESNKLQSIPEKPLSSNSIYRIDVKIIEYKLSEDNKRDLLGIFAGKDIVKSNVRIIDTESNKLAGEFESISSDRSGLINKVETLSKLHAKEIIKFLGGNS